MSASSRADPQAEPLLYSFIADGDDSHLCDSSASDDFEPPHKAVRGFNSSILRPYLQCMSHLHPNSAVVKRTSELGLAAYPHVKVASLWCGMAVIIVLLLILQLSPSIVSIESPMHHIDGDSDRLTSLCRVEESLGYWLDDDSHDMSWYAPLPGQCHIYPFLHELMRLPQPEQISPWPEQTAVSTTAPLDPSGMEAVDHWLPRDDAALTVTTSGDSIDHSQFLRGRVIVWITDSIDRHPLGSVCPRLDESPVWAIHKYAPNVSEHYGLSLCHSPRINLTLIHAQTMGVHPDNELAAMQQLIEDHIPSTLVKALTAEKLTFNQVTSFSAAALSSSLTSVPVHPCLVQPLVPDVLVVHSCLWDSPEPVMAAAWPQDVAIAWWMKRFEMTMLIPTLNAYSQQYRQWQHRFLLQQLNSSSQHTPELSEAYNRLRVQLFTLPFQSTDNNPTLTLAPSPHSHPINLQSDVDDDMDRVESPMLGCPSEPLIVIRNCSPPRSDETDLFQRETTRALINTATRAVSQHYNLRLLDMARMFDGIQPRPNFMHDAVHWNARPWLQTFNLLLNMYKQHLLSPGRPLPDKIADS